MLCTAIQNVTVLPSGNRVRNHLIQLGPVIQNSSFCQTQLCRTLPTLIEVDRNRVGSKNGVFLFQCKMMGLVQKLSNPTCYNFSSFSELSTNLKNDQIRVNLPLPMLPILKVNKPNQCSPESLFGIKYTSIVIYIVKFNIWFIAILLLEFWGWATVAFTTSKLIIISEKQKATLHVTNLLIGL